MPDETGLTSIRIWVKRSSANKELFVSVLLFMMYLVLSIYVKMVGEQNMQYNIQLLTLINSSQAPALNPVMVILSNYGREGPWISVMILLWLFGKSKHKRSTLFMAFSSVLAAIIGELSKSILAQQRPFHYLTLSLLLSPPTDYSYPSGHAIVVASCVVVGVTTLSGYMSVPLFAEAILVSYSRIYTGVHWPIDVLGAWIIGASIALLIPKIVEQISLFRGKKTDHRKEE